MFLSEMHCAISKWTFLTGLWLSNFIGEQMITLYSTCCIHWGANDLKAAVLQNSGLILQFLLMSHAIQLCSTTENDSSFLCLIIFVSFSWSWILRSGILMLLLSRGTDHVNRQCVLTRSCYLIGKFNLVI